MSKKPYVWYEVIVVDARDVDSSEPESTSGILDTLDECETVLAEMLASGQILSWRIVDNAGNIIRQK